MQTFYAPQAPSSALAPGDWHLATNPPIALTSLHFLPISARKSVQFCPKIATKSVQKNVQVLSDRGGNAGSPRNYIVKDGVEHAFDNQIPLWMFGFLY